jgi:hypothetical protein
MALGSEMKKPISPAQGLMHPQQPAYQSNPQRLIIGLCMTCRASEVHSTRSFIVRDRVEGKGSNVCGEVAVRPQPPLKSLRLAAQLVHCGSGKSLGTSLMAAVSSFIRL